MLSFKVLKIADNQGRQAILCSMTTIRSKMGLILHGRL